MNDSHTPVTAPYRTFAALCVLAGSASGLTGCGPSVAGWTLSYDEGRRVADARQADLFVLYKDHLEAESGRLEDVVKHPTVAPLLAGKVKCLLLTEFEPNRRFVGQYGIDEAPALIVIHPDQTYHARAGPLSVDQAVDFLKNAVPPGREPRLNPRVPRTYEYRWRNIHEDALEEAQRRNRKLLIVYKWWLSGESTELLRRLSKPEVARHFADMVHCILDWDYIPNRRHMARYGIQKVPALVIVHQDGTYHSNVGLHDISGIVRFAVNARAPGRKPGTSTRDRVAPPYRWNRDFDRASALARRQDKNLFVFYYSVFSNESNTMEQRLNRSDVASLFSDTVHCKMDWGAPENREVMARYGVSRVPALVIIRPDGTYHARIGQQEIAGLYRLVQDADRAGLSPAGSANRP
ncbi:MAG: hypothetical protein JSV19_06415 [Phycisphaerales bacterium]|nr:MAG: hypothetical protein JSV19_06415 [Phycisphaerales bacterium]